MYPYKKVYTVVVGMVVSSIICEYFDKDYDKIPDAHIHSDYHPVHIPTTSLSAITSSTASGSTLRLL